MKKVLFFIFFIITITACNSNNKKVEGKVKLLAFPTAEGSGAYTVGGRGGKVIEVTNLKDSGKGSLREACNASGSRTVVFRVSGTIDLKGKNIFIKNDNITIAGQTAPGDGIQIKNGGLRVRGNEVIIRYLRLRAGGKYRGVYPLTISSPNRHDRKKNIIADHLSIFWGVDETLAEGSFSDNVTVQWSIIAEGLSCSVYTNNGIGESWNPCKEENGHKIWAHSRGVIISEDSRNISFHHNIIYRNYKRNPLIQSSDADIVNNVIINHQYQAYVEPFKGVVHVNFIGNYFRSYRHKRPPIRVFDSNNGYDAQSGVYYYDNYDAIFRANNSQPETDIRLLNYSNKNDKDGHIQDRNISYPFAKVKTQPVHKAYKLVLEKAGAIYPKRDIADQRVVNFIRSGKAPASLINTPDDVGGYPIIVGGEAPKDSDHDGMPDSWEKEHGLNPKNPEDRNGKELSDIGYTNLEVYLNNLVKGI